jgi:hypothetical protein
MSLTKAWTLLSLFNIAQYLLLSDLGLCPNPVQEGHEEMRNAWFANIAPDLPNKKQKNKHFFSS